jgi:hypothetical protein
MIFKRNALRHVTEQAKPDVAYFLSSAGLNRTRDSRSTAVTQAIQGERFRNLKKA